MFTWRDCSLAAVLLLCGAGCTWASDTALERKTLTGLKSVEVVIENLTPEAEKDGISREQLQTDVELLLRQSGILVVEESGAGVLYVNVNALKRDNGSGYVFAVLVDFEQLVLVPRTALSTIATTWSVGPLVGIVPQATASQDVRQKVHDQIDVFINAYLSVNPKR